VTMDNLERLKQTFHETLGVEPGTDFATVEYGVTAGWDSVAHMGLVAEIERVFDLMMATDDVIDMSSFAKAREILADKHGVAF
jgi:acyl carrier protein